MKKSFNVKDKEEITVPSISVVNEELVNAINDIKEEKLSYFDKDGRRELGYLFSKSFFYFGYMGQHPNIVDKSIDFINFEKNFNHLILELEKKNDKLKEDSNLLKKENISLDSVVKASRDLEDKFDFASMQYQIGKKFYLKNKNKDNALLQK